jgi:hypothetical protein
MPMVLAEDRRLRASSLALAKSQAKMKLSAL